MNIFQWIKYAIMKFGNNIKIHWIREKLYMVDRKKLEITA